MTSLHADEALLTYYQFRHDPFAPRTPGFKFFPAQRKQVLGQLHHLARYSRLLLVVTGPLGSGKTLLRQALTASSNKQTVLCVVVSARASAGLGGMLRQIALGLGLEGADEHEILAEVEQVAASGREVYLLVDDAELLERPALEMLLALAAGSAVGRPHVFLFGEPELAACLQSLGDADERFHVLRLNPYTLEDTREYLMQRLEGAGGSIGVFSGEQIETIHRAAGGWPGEINRLARELLHEEMRAEDEEVAASSGFLPRRHQLALVGVVLAIAAVWFVRGGVQDQPAAPVLVLQPEKDPVALAEPAGGESSVLPRESTGAVEGESQDPLEPLLREPLAQAATEPESEDIGVAGPAVVQAAISTAAPVAAVPTPVPTPAPAPKIAARPVPSTGGGVRGEAAPAAARAGSATDWYRGQAPSRYALQVLGTRSESSAQSFVRAQGAGYRYFKKLYQGQPLFVVTYGSFANRAEAQAAAKGLPAAIRANKPWPRTFASIQQEVMVR